MCRIFTVPLLRKSVANFLPFSSTLQFKLIAGHLHQGNLDRAILSYSLFINLFLFFKRVIMFILSLFFLRLNITLLNLASQIMFLQRPTYFLLLFFFPIFPSTFLPCLLSNWFFTYPHSFATIWFCPQLFSPSISWLCNSASSGILVSSYSALPSCFRKEWS